MFHYLNVRGEKVRDCILKPLQPEKLAFHHRLLKSYLELDSQGFVSKGPARPCSTADLVWCCVRQFASRRVLYTTIISFLVFLCLWGLFLFLTGGGGGGDERCAVSWSVTEALPCGAAMRSCDGLEGGSIGRRGSSRAARSWASQGSRSWMLGPGAAAA